MVDTRPDIIVGVDFGMTCTGVSYVNLSAGSEMVRIIDQWPGRASERWRKFPTLLAYPTNLLTDLSTDPYSWGFGSEILANPNVEYREWFKNDLDPELLSKAQTDYPKSAPKSMQEVEKYFYDFLHLLYKQIVFKLTKLTNLTDAARIEFIFSVPTTWDISVVHNFRSIVEQAGFKGYGTHTVTIGLTDAEAAAVHTSIELPGIFKEKDVFLVVDAGGGTTDLSVLMVTDTLSQHLSLQQLDVVFGAPVGSVLIDFDFQRLVHNRLAEAKSAKIMTSIEAALWDMMKSHNYQNAKCEYGDPCCASSFLVRVPTLDKDYNDPTAQIENGHMRFTADELQGLFDTQISKLFNLIDAHLRTFHQRHPKLQVSIDWFVKQGEMVSVDQSIVHNFSRNIDPDNPRRVFSTNVIMSTADIKPLPCQLTPEVEKLCEVECDLSDVDETRFKAKNRHFWNLGRQYFRVDYQIKVLIGPADIAFELWFDGQKVNQDYAIKVDWMAVAQPK